MRSFKSFLLLSTLLGAMHSGFAANLPPIITPIASQTVAEGGTLSFTVSATDPEGRTVTIGAKRLQPWMSFAGNVFTANPVVGNSGAYDVTFGASDGSTKTTLTVTITVTNTNQAPTVNAIGDKSVSEGATLSFIVTATDPNQDALTLSASPLKSWMTFDGMTFTASPGYADNGSYTLTFSASDGALSGETKMTLTVNDVNQAPIFSTSSSQAVMEGATLSLPINVTDADNNPITITATGLKSWMTFAGTTLTLSPRSGDAGVYLLTLTASDGIVTTKLDMTVTVTVFTANLAPVLLELGNWQIGEGKVLSLPVNATDPDGDPVTITASSLQSWMSFDGKVFRARPGVGTLGEFSVSFTASDASLSVSQSVIVTVVVGGIGYPSPWTSYMGSVGGGADWATWNRHWLAASTGMSLVRDPSLTSSLYSSAASDLATHDLMLPITAFVRDSASMSEFLNLIQDGGVATWQEAVRAEVETLSLVDPSAKRVFYQLGNEITAKSISTNLRSWTASRGIAISGVARSYDTEMIPYYVEYFLAPTVDKVMQASSQYFGDPKAAIIALGSIGNALTTDARAWLDVLLDYQVQGTYAPALQGLRVYDLVDLITVHYVGPNSGLDEIWDKWKNKGRIRGLWTSEEIGSKAVDSGHGAGRALLTTAEQLNWFYKRTLTPEQSRVAFYDWNRDAAVAGTSVNEAMQVLYGFVPNDPLEVFSDGVTIAGNPGTLYGYRLNSVTDNNKRLIIVTPDFTEPALNASVTSVQIDKAGWSGTVTASVHQFSATGGHVLVGATVSQTATGYEVKFNSAVTLVGDGSALLITLQQL